LALSARWTLTINPLHLVSFYIVTEKYNFGLENPCITGWAGWEREFGDFILNPNSQLKEELFDSDFNLHFFKIACMDGLLPLPNECPHQVEPPRAGLTE
jgi:hypothetical protein